MSEQTAVKKSILAKHWGCSAPYVTKLGKSIEDGGKAMPVFYSLENADNWRAVNAPPKTRQSVPQHLSENSTEAAKKNAGVSGTTTGDGKTKETETGATIIDVRKFIRRDKDFDALMIEQAEEKPQIASGLFDLACTRGNSAEISAANKNWHECAKAAAAVKKDFLALQEQTRAVLPLDEVMNILVTELQPVRQALMKLGERCANAANPSDPSLARRVIDAMVDKIFAQLDHTAARTRTELAPPAPLEQPEPIEIEEPMPPADSQPLAS